MKSRGVGAIQGMELGSEEITIGRSPEATIQLPLKNISRIHARVYRMDEEYLVEDLDSTNGTYLNNVRIVRSVLRDNDQIEIGEAQAPVPGKETARYAHGKRSPQKPLIHEQQSTTRNILGHARLAPHSGAE